VHIDPSLHAQGFSGPDAMASRPASNVMNDPTNSFDHNRAAQALQAALNQPQGLAPAPVEIEEKKKKASSSSSATNDKELREMLVRNEGRELKDVAAEVIATDRTSKAEKSKQLFAMLW
jgi:regulatory factor X, other